MGRYQYALFREFPPPLLSFLQQALGCVTQSQGFLSQHTPVAFLRGTMAEFVTKITPKMTAWQSMSWSETRKMANHINHVILMLPATLPATQYASVSDPGPCQGELIRQVPISEIKHFNS